MRSSRRGIEIRALVIQGVFEAVERSRWRRRSH